MHVCIERERERETFPGQSLTTLTRFFFNARVHMCALKIILSLAGLLECVTLEHCQDKQQQNDGLEDIVMLRKAGNATRHKTVVLVLGFLSMDLCQSPVGLPSITLKA